MIKFIRWIRGYVVFEIKGKFPERFINLCVRRGISLFNPVPEGAVIVASMLLCDYKHIKAIARKCGVTLRVKERFGLPFLCARYSSRWGLLAGAAAFVAIIIAMQSFVWTVEIKGLNTISKVEFAKILEDSGVEQGTFKGCLDLQEIQRSIMHDVDEIGWMSINIIGTKAEVEVKEKEKKPDVRDVSKPCNITAAADGIIVSMDTLSGKAVVPVGSAVKKGQLLVSGVVENALQNVHFVHSNARVVAKTTKTANFEVNLKGEYKAPFDTVCRYRFNFFWFSLPVSCGVVRGDYTSRVEKNALFLNNTEVPCGLSAQYCTMYAGTPFEHTRKRAESVSAADEALFRLFALRECETIELTETVVFSEDACNTKVVYSCTQEIGIKENLVVNQ